MGGPNANNHLIEDPEKARALYGEYAFVVEKLGHNEYVVRGVVGVESTEKK